MKILRAFATGCLAMAFVACASSGNAPMVKVVGDHLELGDTIHFSTGNAEIAQESFALLDRIAEVLKASPDIVGVQINGHTDNTGKAEVNKALSEKRAAAVESYLKSKGVAKTMQVQGFGQDKPVCTDDTDDCRYRNRRVEFIIERS